MKRKLNCVLLIDDDEPTNYLHKRIIEKRNCAKNIEVAQSGTQALEFFTERINDKHSQPDLILLDVNMAMMNGWEFLDEYDKLDAEQKKETVIIMLTTTLDRAYKQKAQEIKTINGFQTKPLSEKMLEEILNEHFADRL
ncbi:MAG: response regulator [Flavobacteriales bacterium]|nr:MAG: response regulator [Flavobacteriales bacterium]